MSSPSSSEYPRASLLGLPPELLLRVIQLCHDQKVNLHKHASFLSRLNSHGMPLAPYGNTVQKLSQANRLLRQLTVQYRLQVCKCSAHTAAWYARIC